MRGRRAGKGAPGCRAPRQRPTHLAPGEQRGEAADGPQRQVHVLHQDSCVGRGAGEQGACPP